MFDWLFGDGGKQRKQEEEQLGALKDYRADADVLSQVFNNRVSSGNYTDDNVGTIMNAGDQYGQAVKDSDTQMGDLNKSLKQSRYDYFGNGLLGALLNPIGQTATAGFDLATGQYENNDRDAMSDLGAAGQTALSFLPFAGGLARAGGAVGKIGAGVGKAVNSVPGMAATGAGFNAGETLRQGGSETEMGDLLGAAGTGAAFGAAIPIAGKVGGSMLRKRGSNVLGNELAKSGVADDAAQQFMGSVPNKALYQTALRSFIPKSTVGKLAVGGGALYGGSQLMGMGGGEQPVAQYSSPEIEQIAMELAGQNGGVPPSEYEIMQLMQMQGGY